MHKSAAEWQKVWPSFETQSIGNLERALTVLSGQLGIDTKVVDGETWFSQYVAQFLDKVLEEAKKND
ncbi:MAG: hypothetical protein H7249_00915 [Chitinophagaceae bacterium]|nr:hypothetical protein [Oligoflexus sp.]